MKIKIFIVLLVISPFNASVLLSEEIGASYSASVSTNGSLMFGKNIGSHTSIITEFDIFYSSREDYDIDQVNNEEREIWSGYSSTNVQLQLGLKKYLSNGAYQTFVKPSGGIIIRREQRKYKSGGLILDDEEAITAGALFSAGVGVEYHVTKHLSIEGIYNLRISYLDLDFKEDSKRKETTITDFGALYATYYW